MLFGRRFSQLLAIALAVTFVSSGMAAEPLKALLITGGGYHDYKNQRTILCEGVSSRANIVWDVVLENVKADQLPTIYKDPDFAKNYDIIVHNECYASFSDSAAIDKIVEQHEKHKVGVIAIHCAMHTFRRTKTKEWDNLIGVQSYRHGPKFPITVRTMAPKHPIMQGVPANWTTPQGELYHTSPLPNTKVLAVGYKSGEEEKTTQACVWANEYKGMKVCGITLGHHNETMEDNVYLDLLARAMLWTCDKLEDDGSPKDGYESQTKK